MKRQIIPSIIAKSQGEMERRISKMKGSFSLLQLDMMDGKFVKNKSFDFDFKLPKGLKYEAHLMVKDPVDWIERHGKKVDTIIFHVESVEDIRGVIELIRNKKKRVGIAIKPRTKVSKIKRYLKFVDMILVMTVNPGSYGGKFLPSTLKKVKEIRKMNIDLNIEVDGGINYETIDLVYSSGANMFVSGSYLQKSEDIKRSLTLLESLLGNVGNNNRKEVNNGS